MSTLAKIFVVINFALAVAFLIFTLTLYSKRVKYAEREAKAVAERGSTDKAFKHVWLQLMGTAYPDGLKVDTDTKVVGETSLAKVAEDKALAVKKLAAEKQAAVEEAAREKASAKDQTMKLEESERKQADARNLAQAAADEKKVLLEQVQKMRGELEETRKTVMALKEANVRLQMDTDEFKKLLVDAQNDNTTLKNNIEDLHKDRKRMAEDLANSEFALKDAVSKGYRLTLVNVPDVRTKVVDVRNTGNVALGAGSDSGIKEGTIFLIYRGGAAAPEYIGKIRVTTVWNDFAGGQVIESRTPIKPGDDAMSSRGS
ncbi:MAG TPA: hypothetical protein PK280_19930 [Planctomycetota bacterium]|nr:hypothetical protein [Planctomycetota bacterium]